MNTMVTAPKVMIYCKQFLAVVNEFVIVDTHSTCYCLKQIQQHSKIAVKYTRDIITI